VTGVERQGVFSDSSRADQRPSRELLIDRPCHRRSMTTPTIDQIYRHVSIRQFSPEPVSAELVETIVAAAQR
jgi:hypothetical protein